MKVNSPIAEQVGLGRTPITQQQRDTKKPLYVKAAAKWSGKGGLPVRRGTSRDASEYEQDLTKAPASPPPETRPRRSRIQTADYRAATELWKRHTHILIEQAQALHAFPIPNEDLLEALRELEAVLNKLHDLKKALWRKVLYLSGKKQMVWRHNEDT